MLLSYFLRPPKSAEGGYAGTMGAQRCPVATDRTGIATAATCRWSWSSMAGYPGGAQWNLVGFGHGGTGRELPKKYPPYRTCHRRFQQWVREDKLERIFERAGRGVAHPRKTGSGGGFYRRLLHRG